MIHYHGGPITPSSCAVKVWGGRHAFVSFAHPGQIEIAASFAQSFALDNGAFPIWKSKRKIEWFEYYDWADKWLSHPKCDFAVIPDVIDGTEDANDALLDQWPHGRFHGAPVWHTGESIERLVRLANEWPRVCIGSSGEYDVAKVAAALDYLKPTLSNICDRYGRPVCKLHGLRMLNPRLFSKLPLSSADSTNIARNIGIDKNWRGTYLPASKETRALVMAERIESHTSTDHIEMSFHQIITSGAKKRTVF